MKWIDGNLLVTTATVFGGFGRAASASNSVLGTVVCRVGAERPGRELHVVLGERRNAEGVVHQHLVVALRHAHRRQDGAGRIRPHQQVDLVGGDELLVQRAREVGLGLVVLQHPLDRAAEQAAALVEPARRRSRRRACGSAPWPTSGPVSASVLPMRIGPGCARARPEAAARPATPAPSKVRRFIGSGCAVMSCLLWWCC